MAAHSLSTTLLQLSPQYKIGVGRPQPFLDMETSLRLLAAAHGSFATFTEKELHILDEKALQALRNGEAERGLEGLAKDGKAYINRDGASVDTLVHELLHCHAHEDFHQLGRRWVEGATEFLTIEAMTKGGFPATHSYPEEEAIILKLLSSGYPIAELKTFYFQGGANTLVAHVDRHCYRKFGQVDEAVRHGDWKRARYGLRQHR